jgi:shikimate kinase
MTDSKRIYLIGFMGSGKTTAGKKLATHLGWSFIDLDKEIEHRTLQTINDIFSKFGEDYFRKIEAETLQTLTLNNNAVIATGGGAPCYGNNLDYMLGTGLTIYLQLTPAQLNRRLSGASGDRPLTKNKNKSQLAVFIKEKLAEREKCYLRADLIIDGNNLKIKNLETLIMNHLEE